MFVLLVLGDVKTNAKKNNNIKTGMKSARKYFWF